MAVSGSTSCRPPATVSPRKRSRCLSLPSTWHGNPAKACQVSLPAVHLARFLCKSVSDGISLPPTWHGLHGFSAKACQVAPLAAHLLRNPRESVPGVPSRCPPATVFLRKCSRCLIPLPTWHGIPAKAFQVSHPAVHLPRYPR